MRTGAGPAVAWIVGGGVVTTGAAGVTGVGFDRALRSAAATACRLLHCAMAEDSPPRTMRAIGARMYAYMSRACGAAT